jgi:hypothetical protein
MKEEINEIRSIKKAISAGMKKVKDFKFKKNQVSAAEGNAKLKAMFNPKSSYTGTKMNLEPGRVAKADLAIKKMAADLK